jgi:hypothetical protein
LSAEEGAGADYSLAATIHRRDLTNLITWPINGILPAQLRGVTTVEPKRRGPTPSQPALGKPQRRQFFDRLVRLAEVNQRADPLLCRQAMYLLSFDEDGLAKDWLLAEHSRCGS